MEEVSDHLQPDHSLHQRGRAARVHGREMSQIK